MLALDLAYVRGDFRLEATAELGPGVTGIVGASGAGKSTLLALLAGLLAPARGRIVLDGEVLVDSARGLFVPPWRRRVGLVYQDGQLFPHMTVRGNLAYGWRRLAPADRRFGIDQVVGLLELGPLLDRRPGTLSGGERQRVAVGRALLQSPRLLLLDEPLSALDQRLRDQILPFLLRAKRETGLPMCYVSHVRAEVDYLADRVLAIEHGRLVDAAAVA